MHMAVIIIIITSFIGHLQDGVISNEDARGRINAREKDR